MKQKSMRAQIMGTKRINISTRGELEMARLNGSNAHHPVIHYSASFTWRIEKKKKRGSGACSHASQWAVWASDGTSVFPTHRLYLGRAPRYIKVCPSIFADSKIISFEIIFTWFCSFRSSGKFILDIHFLGSLTFMWFFLIFFFKVKVQ